MRTGLYSAPDMARRRGDPSTPRLAGGGGAMAVTFGELVSLAQAIVWPVVVLVIVLVFRRELPRLAQALSGRLAGFSAVGVTVEFAAVEPAAGTLDILSQIQEPTATGAP